MRRMNCFTLIKTKNRRIDRTVCGTATQAIHRQRSARCEKWTTLDGKIKRVRVCVCVRYLSSQFGNLQTIDVQWMFLS
jgi:hypothetical protein